MNDRPRILALCDSPATRMTQKTGFARVARNLFSAWESKGALIEIWGIGFDGWGYDQVPWKIFPGGNADWNSPRRLTEFLQQLATGGYTHVWILMDANALDIGDGDKSFSAQLKKVCKANHIRSMLYFPVDADDFDGMPMVRAVDVAVTYTQYGKEVVQRTALECEQFSAPPIHVLPHGLEDNFKPLPDRLEIRKTIMADGKVFAGPDDFLIVNVNKNEWRKDPLRSLEILKGLLDRGIPAKLILRMGHRSNTGGIHLKLAADQLGLPPEAWTVFDMVAEEDMPQLYNAADLYLTTSLGEGWGLGVTEALGCGTPVAMPPHTSFPEIERECFPKNPNDTTSVVWLPIELGCVMGTDTRLRRRVQLTPSINFIAEFYRSGTYKEREPMRQRDWLSWNNIAAKMLELLLNKNEGEK